ncbi:MAG: histidine phosphatase family protein [Hungatella sp.]|nr:histidine phosphatase family protein [Hungatella sp.]
MKRTLYLMRHGETMFNVQKRIQGWCDSPLTQKGRQQAVRAGRYFKERGIVFDYACCSTSERCSDTLELVTDMPYTRLKGLKEMFYGELEGESERLNCKTPEECVTYYLQFGGESSDEVRDRMTKTLSEVMEQDGHTCVLAVSHSGACFNFLRGIQDPMEELKKGLGNCCIFAYEYEEGRFTLKEVIRQNMDR